MVNFGSQIQISPSRASLAQPGIQSDRDIERELCEKALPVLHSYGASGQVLFYQLHLRGVGKRISAGTTSRFHHLKGKHERRLFA